MMKQERKNGRQSIGRLLCLGMAGLLCCLLATSCGKTWDKLWERTDETSVNSDLLIIPGSGGPEDTFETMPGAVEYTGEPHEGTDIYYVGNGEARDKIIVIDAGHQAKGNNEQEPIGPGASETKAQVSWGAQGEYSGEEHALNLEVALLLRDELISRGYSVVMIRETADVDISNKERAEIANHYNAAAYVRIHANYYEDTTMQGAMTICQSQENPFPDCAAMYRESRMLSEGILQAFCSSTGMARLEIREMDNMTGTNWSKVPTTILEMGFLSNESDDMLMKTQYFKKQAAIGIADGLDRYFEIMDAFESESLTENASSVGDREAYGAETD